MGDKGSDFSAESLGIEEAPITVYCPQVRGARSVHPLQGLMSPER